jgi:tetratricopeptide (TPR) repeat protein
MSVRYLALSILLLVGATASAAQTPTDSAGRTAAEEIALGDSAAARMQPPAEALAHYQAALAIDSTNYLALCRASRDAVAEAEFEKDKDKRTALFLDGERYARAAVKLRPDDAEGHFFLARALGRVALTKGKSDRVKYGKEVYQQAQQALQLDSTHAGALHVMGMWNYEVMSLSGFSRFMAKTFLGGDILGKASWDNARRYMEQSVQSDPDRLVHHLDLGKVYRHTKEPDKAREQFEIVVNGTPTEYNDRFYKEEAESNLKAMNDGN